MNCSNKLPCHEGREELRQSYGVSSICPHALRQRTKAQGTAPFSAAMSKNGNKWGQTRLISGSNKWGQTRLISVKQMAVKQMGSDTINF